MRRASTRCCAAGRVPSGDSRRPLVLCGPVRTRSSRGTGERGGRRRWTPPPLPPRHRPPRWCPVERAAAGNRDQRAVSRQEPGLVASSLVGSPRDDERGLERRRAAQCDRHRVAERETLGRAPAGRVAAVARARWPREAGRDGERRVCGWAHGASAGVRSRSAPAPRAAPRRGRRSGSVRFGCHGSSSAARRAARAPTGGCSRRAGRTSCPCSTGLNTRKYGAASVPQPAVHCQPCWLDARSPSTSQCMKCRAPCCHSMCRSLTRKLATIIRTRLCIQPSPRSCRMPGVDDRVAGAALAPGARTRGPGSSYAIRANSRPVVVASRVRAAWHSTSA